MFLHAEGVTSIFGRVPWNPWECGLLCVGGMLKIYHLCSLCMYEEQLSSDHCYQWSVYKEMQEHIYHVCVCPWHPEPLRGYRKKKKGVLFWPSCLAIKFWPLTKPCPFFSSYMHSQQLVWYVALTTQCRTLTGRCCNNLIFNKDSVCAWCSHHFQELTVHLPPYVSYPLTGAILTRSVPLKVSTYSLGDNIQKGSSLKSQEEVTLKGWGLPNVTCSLFWPPPQKHKARKLFLLLPCFKRVLHLEALIFAVMANF